MSRKNRFFLLILPLILVLFLPVLTGAHGPVVNAILFYSPTCPHCHRIMTEFLPPLADKYGDQLVIVPVDVGTPEGQGLYQATVSRFQITRERMGVPTLVVGDDILVGGQEIPALFPGILTTALESNGLDWPDIPGLDNYLSQHEILPTKEAILQPFEQPPTVGEKFAKDPVGNSLAVVVLLGMVFSVVRLVSVANNRKREANPWPMWTIPVMVLAGLAISGYLTYVEYTNAEALCGPVGDCNAVQESHYSHFLGIIPMGVVGLAGYATIGLSWLVATFGDEKRKLQAVKALWWLSLVGTLYSIYLTFLEPFVIGATCSWCLTSAIIMTLLFWAATGLLKETQKVRRTRKVRAKRRSGSKAKTRASR